MAGEQKGWVITEATARADGSGSSGDSYTMYFNNGQLVDVAEGLQPNHTTLEEALNDSALQTALEEVVNGFPSLENLAASDWDTTGYSGDEYSTHTKDDDDSWLL